jgi:enoyl-CoA hydratase
MQVWAHLTCPTVALINGHALGGGCELALACDWRIMARGPARIGLPEVRRGLLPAAGGTQRVLRLVGAARARDIAMLGRLLDADTAAAIGLVTEACDAEDLEGAGEKLVSQILALPFMASAAIKRCLLEGAEVSLAEGMLIERREAVGLADSADSVEGIRAFVEKREPEWSHR